MALPLVPYPRHVEQLGGVCVLASLDDVEVRLDTDRVDLGDEGYELLIGVDGIDGAVVVAATAHGAWNGSRTMKQLAPVGGAAVLPCVHIVDTPRFGWRGAMLDVARHFFGPAEVCRFIELIAEFKLNRLHLHLSDDQGWRLDVPGWPALVRVGGSSAVGGDDGGWYSTDDWASIVAHAERHFVTIVPELDMPGHTNGALASVPQLNRGGVATDRYTGKGVGFSSLHLDVPATGAFVAEVLAHLAAVTPGPWLHIGGDEAAATDHDEYVAFIELLQREAHRFGKQTIGWEEITAAPLHSHTLVQHWLNPATSAAAPDHAKFVLSPARHTYLDMRHDVADPLGRRWAGDIDVDVAYEWDPAELLPAVGEARIAGVEAPLWTEKVRTIAEVEHLCFPRLLCLAEVGWTPQAHRSFAEFRVRLAEQTDRLVRRGVHAYRSSLLHDR